MKLTIRFFYRRIDLLLLAFYILDAALIHSYAPHAFVSGGCFGVMIVFIGDSITDLILLNLRARNTHLKEMP